MRSQEEENEQMGMYDEDEHRLFKNTDSNGRFHSDWCSMMYSRLMLARNLLKDDGVIFISIDDANRHFLRTAGPHFPDSPGHIKRTAWDISRAEGTPPH